MNKDYIVKFMKDSWKALRPFSLTLAIGSTTLGMIAAYKQGYINFSDKDTIFLIIIITIAGVLAQAGSNLVNDYFEGSFRYYRPSNRKVMFLGVERSYFDIYVFLWAMLSFGLAALIGLYLIYITDYRMLVIGALGIFGAYAYTGEPFVFKRKGLGALISFLLMGPLMLLGAYLPFAKDLSIYPFILGLPITLFIPALMISNEMRDFKRDTNLSLGTLSVRIGSRYSKLLYRTLVFSAFALTILYILLGIYPIISLSVFATLPLAFKANKCVSNFENLGIPYTNNLHWTFTLILILTLIL